MATTTFLSNAYVLIGAVDVSDQCSAVSITEGFESLEFTALGGGGGHVFAKGLESVEVTLTMFNSYGAGEVEATLAAVVGVGTTSLFIRPSSAAISTTNPEYQVVNAMLASFTPINSTVGELSTVEVTFTGGTCVRDVTP